MSKSVYVIMRRSGDPYELSDDAIVAFLNDKKAKGFCDSATAAWRKLEEKLNAWRNESNEAYQASDWVTFEVVESKKPALKTRYDKDIPEDTSSYWIQEVRLSE